MVHHTPDILAAQHFGHIAVAAVLHGDGGGADHARAADAAGDGQHDDHGQHTGAEHSHHNEHNEHSGDALPCVNEPLEDQVELAANDCAGHADDHRDHGGEDGAGDAQNDGGTRTVDHVAEHIHAHGIGAQRVLERGGFAGVDQAGGQHAVLHFLRGEHIGKDGNQNEEDQNDHAEEGDLLGAPEQR